MAGAISPKIFGDRNFAFGYVLCAMSPKFGDRVDGWLCPRKFSGTISLHLAMSPKFGTVEGSICPEK